MGLSLSPPVTKPIATRQKKTFPRRMPGWYLEMYDIIYYAFRFLEEAEGVAIISTQWPNRLCIGRRKPLRRLAESRSLGERFLGV